MVRTRQYIRSLPGRLFALLATAVFVLSLCPISVQADDIDDMLAAGNYVEGEVIAAILTEGLQTEDESDAPYEVTELISVDPYAVQQAVEDEEAQGSAKNSAYSIKVTTSLSDSINLCVVSSDTMSTEELLRMLADDPNVVFAEPNYLLDMDSEDFSSDPIPEDEEAPEGSESEPGEQETPEEGEKTPDEEEVPEGEVSEPEEQEVSEGGEGELEDDEAQKNGEATSEEQEDTEADELLTEEEEDTEDDESTDEEDEEPQIRAGEQPADGPLSDLTPLQWGNWTTSQTTRAVGMASNPSINVPGFGSVGRDGNMDKQIVVALLDTGVYNEHPDLENVVYHFTPEQQEALGCWEWGFNSTGKGMYGNVRDEGSTAMGHGTHTAGIIGAEWNGFGTSGVASNVKIVCIQLADSDGTESLADALIAYDFVNRFNELVPEEERIRVTSNSWSRYSSSRALDAVLRDLGERWGIVSVFSSGNDGKNNDRYEKTPSSSADNPYVIVVGNTSPTDRLNPSSEYGTATVDLAAPGTNILSTAVEDHGSYFPDGARESNLLYFGFDGNDTIPIKISQVYGEDEPDVYEDEPVVIGDIATPTDSVRFFGSNGIEINLDPDYMVVYDEWADMSDLYDLQFDIDLTGTGISERLNGVENLKVGLAYSVPVGEEGLIGFASSNAAFITVNVPNEDDEPFQVTRPVGSYVNNFYPASNVEWGFSDFVITCDNFYDYDYNEDLDPYVASVSPEGDILTIKLRVQLTEGCTTFYIDSLGVGTQSAPYEFATGTSMACPAVAGAAALYASQGYEGIELASLIRSKVRIPEGGPLETRSGGVFDFTVEGSPDGTRASEPVAPAITDVTVEGTSLTVTGVNFGTAPGAAALARYVVGGELQPVEASVASWADDEVIFELASPAEGILRVEIANAGGKHDTFMRFATKSSNVYEQDLPFDAGTADVYNAIDGDGDWETRGPVVGLGCKLYYLPAYCGKEDEHPAYKRLRCFDLKTEEWSELPELPEWLEAVSATMYEGKIVVEGCSMYMTEWGEPSGKFPDGKAEERVYVYDSDAGSWSQASAEGIYLKQSIVNNDGQLMVLGGSAPDPDFPDGYYSRFVAPLRNYDLATGAGEEICEIPAALDDPIVAAKDGTILMYSSDPYLEFIRIQNGEAVYYDDMAPDFFLSEGDEPVDGAWGNPIRNQYLGVLGPVSDGFVLAGPPSTEGVTDTYILREGSDKFEPYEKRSSDDRVYSQAGCTYRGRLFVIGSAWFEPETRLFRATAMDVPEYPGDIPCEEKVSITYDPAGGKIDGDTKPVTVKAYVGDTVTIKAAPTRTGYTFLYWKYADAKYYPGDKYTVAGENTFTAVWKKNSDSPTPSSPATGDSTGMTQNLVTMVAAFSLLLVILAIKAGRRRVE